MASGRCFFAAPIDLKKKLIFARKTIILGSENGVKLFVKVCTNGKVSYCVEKAPVNGRNKLFPSRIGQLTVQGGRKVNKLVNNTLKCLKKPKKLGFGPGKVCIFYDPTNLCCRLTSGCSYQSRGLQQKMFKEIGADEKSLGSRGLLHRSSMSCMDTRGDAGGSRSHPGTLYASLFNEKKERSSGLTSRCRNERKESLTLLESFGRLKLSEPCSKRINISCFRNKRHRDELSRVLLRGGDVEQNPGPEADNGIGCATTGGTSSRQNRRKDANVLVTSLNVRGLNDETKLRHLVNYCYKKNATDKDAIFLFQESFITKQGKIPFLWRGNYHLTPGTGNSCGCLTLLSGHLNVVEARDFGNRGHALVCQKSSELKPSYIIINLYAPCPNVQEKIEFFEKVFKTIGELELAYNCSNIIVGGDFNLNFGISEVRNRNYSAQESRIANIVSNLTEEANLGDIWQGKPLFTWRRPNTDIFSSIDRIFVSKASFQVTLATTNWSVSFSDHAAIETSILLKEVEVPERAIITRLDPSLLSDPLFKNQIGNEFNEMYSKGDGGWNPHLKPTPETRIC